LTGFTAIVINHNATGTNHLKCNWNLTTGPNKIGEDMVLSAGSAKRDGK